MVCAAFYPLVLCGFYILKGEGRECLIYLLRTMLCKSHIACAAIADEDVTASDSLSADIGDESLFCNVECSL